MSRKPNVDQYLARPHECPACGCDHIEGGSIEIDTGSARQDVVCKGCGANWTDTYNLSGFINWRPE